jgi:hypothetical protein
VVTAVGNGERQKKKNNNTTGIHDKQSPAAGTGTGAGVGVIINDDGRPLHHQLRDAIRSNYPTVKAAWEAFDGLSQPPGQLSRADFKAMLNMLGLKVTSKQKGDLRKQMAKYNCVILCDALWLLLSLMMDLLSGSVKPKDHPFRWLLRIHNRNCNNSYYSQHAAAGGRSRGYPC